MTESTRTSIQIRRRLLLSLLTAATAAVAASGCSSDPKPYGRETIIFAPKYGPKSLAVAPALNLSGQRTPDALLQADLVYQELQQVRGVTVVPVNRTVGTLAGLGLRQVESPEQAWAVCDAMGVDALLVPTITAYDPYDPPKMGASLQMFVRKTTDSKGTEVDVRRLSRQPVGQDVQSLPKNADFIQVARMFDASAGTTRGRVSDYARGRTDPTGPMGEREYYMNMDRYSAFVWHELIEETLKRFAN
jgi:hypothetical protein